jgi:beta-glucosidase
VVFFLYSVFSHISLLILARVPTAGRNFEYLSGEDPVLGAILVDPIVRGIQENGLIATAKHFINNEIEDHRMLVSANVDERTQFELYYPPFESAINAGVLSVMCSYNRINDVYACQNNDTLTHLRTDMGFQGYVVSDWTAVKSTAKSLKATMDQEMPLGLFYSELALQKQLDEEKITQQDIDNSVTHILYALYASGQFDEQKVAGDPMANVTSEAHNQLARETAAKSIVLLKNDAGLLPINENTISAGKGCIAVFGDDKTIAGGGEKKYCVPLQLIENKIIPSFFSFIKK